MQEYHGKKLKIIISPGIYVDVIHSGILGGHNQHQTVMDKQTIVFEEY